MSGIWNSTAKQRVSPQSSTALAGNGATSGATTPVGGVKVIVISLFAGFRSKCGSLAEGLHAESEKTVTVSPGAA